MFVFPPTPDRPVTFAHLGLAAPLLRALDELGYRSPTPIQQQGIPPVLAARDVMAAAQTGTGKTASFAVPLLQRLAAGGPVRANQARALVLVPTRELAVQVGESIKDYGRHLSLRSVVVYGGVKINPQMMALRRGADLLVATPGRLLDLYRQNAVRFEQLEVLVLDEADRMLDLGFSDDIRKLLELLPRRRQNLLYSATFPDGVRALARALLHNPVEITIGLRNTTAKSVRQAVYEVDKGRKPALLTHLIHEYGWEQVLVFCRTKEGADRLAAGLERDGVQSAALHGDKSQGARSRILAEFKAGALRVLVATDLAARGLDIAELPCVVNFDLPKVAQDYVHRIGRTGRAGSAGLALSLVSADEVPLLAAVENLIRRTLVRETEPGFVPRHSVPLTRLSDTPPKPKKPKKPKVKPEQSTKSNTSPKAKPTRGQSAVRERPALGASSKRSGARPAKRRGQPR